jgi:membrane protein
MAFLIILTLIFLLIGSLTIDTLKGFFDLDNLNFGGVAFTDSVLYVWLRWLLPLMIKFLLFLAIYSWIPRNKEILFRARFIGALVGAVLWDLASRALTWAISAGFTNFELVYGSLSSIIALLTWLYLTGYIIFWGAHLTHAVNFHICKPPDIEKKHEVADLHLEERLNND